MEKTWRWFGYNDSVQLSDLRQMGIEGVVTALHHVPNGEVWPVSEILKVKTDIENHGMRWSVVESLPVSEGIKIHSSDYDRLIANYRQSLRNLGQCGIDTVCYNFMPVLDWARTDLQFKLPNGGESMYFDYPTFAAFDIFILKRPDAQKDYPDWMVQKAEAVFSKMSEAEAEKLAHNIIVVTQGFINGTVGDVADYKTVFLGLLQNYSEIDRDGLRKNLSAFLNDVVPVAEEAGINLCIHPDDPPYPVLGLPRIAGTIEDFKWITEQNKSLRNGITFCSGSLSARADNDLVEFVHQLGDRIHFIHLRNTQMLEDGSFYESGHLKGSVDMYELVKALLEEQHRRKAEGRSDYRMPMRPDHGIKILTDYQRQANPGYPLTGRLKGLAEITGLEMGIERALFHQPC
ncbi:MAG: mannonate dehydratase [Bacteroidetes bacterium GWF2_42_66]|nr:MAG: mannonate dehydratase [Bacteroidetes bacterium GWA2_42_15]OFX97344.1 MAG: mannonate dehydratase [Bacteroidetes bacterium GWE2_42_39]OFY39981.1 MAG: mannonate dehydratase [Bacteroidetes bacterium GWF2_42_66]HBL78175.1 mannonate dehydratase [Prolixibacteraceae bacterium]HCR89466.1 mannonate dehydratase [Prolixibacteraceae bacterium]